MSMVGKNKRKAMVMPVYIYIYNHRPPAYVNAGNHRQKFLNIYYLYRKYTLCFTCCTLALKNITFIIFFLFKQRC